VAVRFIALFNQPDDPEAFDRHYREVHLPILRRYPRVRDVRLTRPDGVAGRPSPIYLMAEAIFDSRADADAALASEPGIESGRDLRNFAAAGVTLLIADEHEGMDA
jgi:uncharacterized protein (TIGR02118 family)